MKTYSKKTTQKAWAMYDWANSVYSLVITSAIFPLYYEGLTSAKYPDGKILILGREIVNTALINYVSAIGFLVLSVLIPILTGIADHYGRKKFFLRLFCYLGAASCAGLAFFDVGNPNQIGWTLLFYFMALIGFWSSIVFYNSYLPEIASPEEHDKLSAKGFSYGYVGSVILLASCLILIQGFGMNPRIAFVLTAIWWAGFTIWPLKVLPSSTKAKDLTDSKVISQGLKEIKYVWERIKKTVRLKRYIQAFFCYSMGVQTVMLVAVYFAAKEIDWLDDGTKTTGLIISILLIQLIAVPGAYVMSWMSSKMGNVKALVIVNVFWAIICTAALYIYTPTEFYFMAACVGFVMGGIQSLSRSTYSKFLPEVKDTATYFSFYDVSEKVGIVIGLFLFGFLEELGRLEFFEPFERLSGMRLSVVSLIVFFFGGIILLLRVPKEEVSLDPQT